MDDLPDRFLHDGHDVGAAEKLDQSLLSGDLRLGQDVQVAELAFIPGIGSSSAMWRSSAATSSRPRWRPSMIAEPAHRRV